MEDRIREFLSKRRIAVAGATPRKDKWGYKVFRCLRDHGYEVYPIHPQAEEVDGVPCSRSLAEASPDVEAVSVIIPPGQGEQLVRECRSAGVRHVWFQPGAESPEAIAYCEANGISVIHHACVLTTLGCF